MSTMITTNVRMTSENLMLAKETAHEMGMSFNEYMNYLAKDNAVRYSLGIEKKRNSSKKLSLWDLPKIAREIKPKPMGASEDDKIIYGIK